MGTTLLCDCLAPEEKNSLEQAFEKKVSYDLHQVCSRGKNAVHSENCFEVSAIPPVVMNVVNGLRYCGKRGGYSLNKMIRPVKTGSSYKCPNGFRPCNEFFFDVQGGQDYVVCID